MVITYYGISCIKIQNGETVLVIDPFSKESGLLAPRFQASVLLSTNADPNHSNIEAIGGEPFVINTAGEFEREGILIHGIPTTPVSKSETNGDGNTAYIMEWDSIRLVHLGNLQKKDFNEQLAEEIGTPDIVFIPVGGGDTLNPEEAAVITNQIEPRVTIPVRFKTPGLKLNLPGVDKFAKELGVEEPRPEEKFTFKKRDLPQDGTRLIILSPAR